MGRLAIALLCALACHGLLIFLPVADQQGVLPDMSGRSSITIRLTALPARAKEPVPRQIHQAAGRQPASPVVLRPKNRKKRLAKSGVEDPVPLQPAERQAAVLSPGASSSGNAGGSRAPTMVRATPLYQSNPKPVYPPLARRRGQQGTVMLQVMVAENGHAEQVTLHKSSGFPLLDEAAVETVKKWQFIPGTENGHSAATEVLVPVHFKLQ